MFECNFNAEKDHMDLSKYKSDTPQITKSYKSEISKDEVGFRIILNLKKLLTGMASHEDWNLNWWNFIKYANFYHKTTEF